jgi:hypothetical protein
MIEKDISYVVTVDIKMAARPLDLSTTADLTIYMLNIKGIKRLRKSKAS